MMMAMSKHTAMIGAAVALIVSAILLMAVVKKDPKRTKTNQMILEILLALAVIATLGMGAIGFGFIKGATSDSSSPSGGSGDSPSIDSDAASS